MFQILNQRRSLACQFGLIFLLVAPSVAAAQSPATPDTAPAEVAMVVLSDGRRLHMECGGTGRPTVMLDAGLGLDSAIWMRVRPGLAAVTRTCVYDRAGYGRSDPGPMPRHSAYRASDLTGLLTATEEQGPFVLVAHSAAEQPARLVAAGRPDLVAGLVLVDPGADLSVLREIGPEWAAAHDAGQAAALICIRATAAGEMRPGSAVYVECGSPPINGPLANRAMAAAVLSENEPDPPGMATAPTEPGSLGAIPVIVLTARDKFGPRDGAGASETEPLRQAWSGTGAAIAATSTRGELRLIDGASHVIQFEQPQAVIDAVTDVVTSVRSRSFGTDSAS